jgi:hypothetical protein
VAKTAPMRQWEVARELRARVKAALDAAGVAPAGPDTIVITAPSPNGGSPPEDPAAPLPASVEPAEGTGIGWASEPPMAVEVAQDAGVPAADPPGHPDRQIDRP